MKPYCSLTGTRTTLAMLRASDWGVLVTPDTWARCHVPEGMTLACDNGAWGAFAGNRAWDAGLFVAMAHDVCRRVEWVVVPDVVGLATASWEQTSRWMDWCLSLFRRVLVAVQDGMETWTWLADVLGPRVGVFIGGSTEWKLRTVFHWCGMARAAGAVSHVGRVNSAKRMHLCAAAGADSVDGNSSVLFPVTHRKLDAASRQRVLAIGV